MRILTSLAIVIMLAYSPRLLADGDNVRARALFKDGEAAYS